MGVFLDIALSVLLGSALILLILTYNFDMVDTNNINNLYRISQKNGIDFQDIMKNDFKKIGLGISVSDSVFTIADSNEIKFRTDLNLDGSINEIHYYLGDVNSANFTENPEDKIFYRRIDNDPVENNTFGLISLNFTYFDENGNQTTNLNEIKQIRYTFYIESTFQYNNQYPGIYLRGRIKPKNLY